MKQQTAVDFLLSELDIAKLIEREKLTMAAEVVRQAKEMEKEQMIDFIDDYINNCCYVTKIGDIGCNKTAEQYYNETYNK